MSSLINTLLDADHGYLKSRLAYISSHIARFIKALSLATGGASQSTALLPINARFTTGKRRGTKQFYLPWSLAHGNT